MRLLAKNAALLGQIAAHVRGLPWHTLSPPTKEVCELRLLNWRLELERYAEREASEMWRLTLDSMRRDWAAKEKQYNQEINRLQTSLSSVITQATLDLVEANKSSTQLVAQLQSELSEFKSKIRCQERAHWKEEDSIFLE